MSKIIITVIVEISKIGDIEFEGLKIAEKGDLPPKLAKTLEKAKAKGYLTCRECLRLFGGRGKASEGLEIFKELEKMGYGKLEKIKNSVRFIPKT